MGQIRGISWACSPWAFDMQISETLRANLQGEKVQNVSLSQSSMYSISEVLPLYFDSWRYFCCFYLVKLLHVAVFYFHVTETDFFSFFSGAFVFQLCLCLFPLKFWTHTESLWISLIILISLRQRYGVGFFYALCDFRMRCCSLSSCFHSKPYARFHFSSQTSHSVQGTPLFWKLIFWLNEGYLVK